MSKETLRKLLTQLHEEVGAAQLDNETRDLLTDLDADLHAMLIANESQQQSAVSLDRAKLLEANFAVRHPTLERFAREIVDALARMGV